MTEQNLAVPAKEASAIELLQQPQWDLAHLYRIREVLFGDPQELQKLKAWTQEQTEDSLLLGRALWALGLFQKALPILEAHGKEPGVSPLLALAYLSLGRSQEGIDAIGSPTTPDEACASALAKARLVIERKADLSELQGLIADPGLLGETAVLPFLEGLVAELQFRIDDAIESYQRSQELFPGLSSCAFRLARLLEMRGNDEEALEIYETFHKRSPSNVAVLMNLGILYEDLCEWKNAEACFQEVQKVQPDNPRVQLFLQDVQASMVMHYDEDLELREDKRNAILRTPVTDFELSVRSRNCLAKMGIRTLGDLVRKTEAELLSYKNFGETSLLEIQEILNAKSLSLGMDPDELSAKDFGKDRDETPDYDPDDPRGKSITLLDLSVRSRRVIEQFKLRTIGDLCQRTEAELMACPNFGQTSLNEIRSKLDELGLALRS